MKKALALILSIIMVLSLFAGCGKKEEGPVELTLQLWDEAQLPTIQENVDKFNAANEGKIHVTIEQIPWDTYWTKLDASLETDEAPDVFWMNVYVHKYASAGLLQPLDEYIKAENFDMSIYAQGRVNAYNLEGTQYALPKGLDAVAVALNTEIFERYGVELPQAGWNWDDMRAIATELRDAIAAAGGSEYPIVMELDAQPSWMNFLYQNGGYYLSDDGKSTGIGLDASKDAIAQTKALMDEGHMAPYSVLSETKGTDLFISGQAAIVFIGSWKASVLEGSTLAEAGHIQLIEMPNMAEHNGCGMGGLGYVMSTKCENKEAAWELIKFITSPEAMQHEAEKGIDIPACLSAQGAYVANFKNINAQVFMDASANGFAYPSNGNFDWTGYIDDAISAVFAGVKDVDTALDEAQAQAQAVLDELYK